VFVLLVSPPTAQATTCGAFEDRSSAPSRNTHTNFVKQPPRLSRTLRESGVLNNASAGGSVREFARARRQPRRCIEIGRPNGDDDDRLEGGRKRTGPRMPPETARAQHSPAARSFQIRSPHDHTDSPGAHRP